MSEPSMKRPTWATVMLVVLPLWLVSSGAFAMWYYFHNERKTELLEQERFATTVSADSLADDLKKIVEVIGERNGSSETASTNLGRIASMIEGTLGPSNTGYTVRRMAGPAQWPLLQATLRGTDDKAGDVWVISSYDSRPGSPGVEANATGIVASMAAAQAVAADIPACNVHFLFIPHANDPEAPILETATQVKSLVGDSKNILCLEAMGAEETLWLTSRDTSAPPLSRIQGLGSVRGAEVVCLGEDQDLASVLFEMNLPAVRVATRPMLTPEESDNATSNPNTLAGSTGRLVELIRRCANPR
jgi:hypothetical protein